MKKSSYSPVKNLVYIPILAIQFLLIRSVTALNLTNAYLHHKCLVNEGQYQPGSEYEENLNHIVRLISSYNFQDGFRHTTHGEAPNSITVVIQCRGDSYGSNCRSCFTTAVAGLRRRCQRNKGAIIWYDQCLLHVSTIKSRSPKKIDYENSFSMYNPNKMSGDTTLFNKKMKEFLYNLMLKANTSPMVYYAVGEERLGTKKLYAMMQCTKDTFSCGDCLKWSISELSKCCDGKQGARVLGTSCNLRYELYPFLRT